MNALLNFDNATLKKLLLLKLLMLILSIVVLGFTYLALDIELEYVRLLWLIIAGAIVLAAWYLRSLLSLAVSEWEVFFLLVSDIIIVSLLIHFSGASANPFTSSLLVPLALAAALLTKRLGLTLVIITLCIYAWWTFSSNAHDHMNHDMFSLHLYGMWVNFLLCAIILFFFITYATQSIKQREYHLQQAREKILRDEQLVAIATLTASTAHALGTPLSTMSILVEEWRRENSTDPEKKMLSEQLDVCKKYLARIGQAVNEGHAESISVDRVKNFYDELRDQVLLLRPTANLDFSLHTESEMQNIRTSPTLLFAIVNLIENAIESGGTQSSVAFQNHENNLQIIISDNGDGLPPDLGDLLGRGLVSSKTDGWGVGVYLSNSTVERFGGKISMKNRQQGGTLTLVELPFHQKDAEYTVES